jgi:NAD(P)-dependent dehydrogenase (short-subunit alcohol dehydrogenase family)
MFRKAIQMARKKADIDIPNLRGKLALVTGASDGLGLEIARRLALAGAEVILPVRNPKKGAAAVDRIAAEAPDSVVSTRVLARLRRRCWATRRNTPVSSAA